MYPCASKAKAVLAIAFLNVMSAVSFSQVAPPGGPGGGGVTPPPPPYDGNPTNPVNWKIETILEEKTEVWVDWVVQNGVDTAKSFTYAYPAPPGGPQPMHLYYASNSTSNYHTVSKTLTAKYKVKASWLSPYPAPAKVLLKISAGAHASYQPSGGASVNNAIGSPTDTYSEGLLQHKFMAGEKYLQLPLSSGVAEKEFTLTANATGDGNGSLAGSHASLNGYLAEKAVQVTADRDPTTHKGPAGTPVPNVVEDFEAIEGDTVATPYGWPFGWHCSVTFGRILHGSWTDEFHDWSVPPSTFTDDYWTEYTQVWQNWEFSQAEVESMATGGPTTKTASLTLTDDGGNGVTRKSKYSLRIHAPAENVVATITDPNKRSTTFVDSNVISIPYGGTPLTQALEFAGKITVSANLNLGSSTGAEATIELVKVIVNRTMSIAVSGSAEVSWKKSQTQTFTGAANPGQVRKWWYRRWALSREVKTEYDSYGPSGYLGHVIAIGTTFRSPDAVTAAANDYEDEQKYEDVPI